MPMTNNTMGTILIVINHTEDAAEAEMELVLMISLLDLR